MKYNKNVKKAEFINRPNRFNAVVKLEEEEITAHVPNTGRCGELLVEGYTVFLREKTFGKSRFDFKISNDLGAKNDVDIFAYNCIVTEDGIEINEEVEIILT